MVFERDQVPGGCAGVIDEGGYRIDSGPVVLTMPRFLEEVFASAGATMSDHLTLRPVDPMYRACFPDGSELRLRHGVEAMTDEIRKVCGDREAAAFVRFSRWLRDLYEVELPHFINRNFDAPLDLARAPWALLRLVQLGALRRLAPTVAGYFHDPRLQQLFSFQSLYAGLSPFEALAVFGVITYMDSVEGVYFPMGGMHEVARSLSAAAEKGGATLAYGTPVARVTRHPDGSVAGVALESGESIPADVVVCNADVAGTYRSLLGIAAPRTIRSGAYSPSCALWLAGGHGELPAGAAHHNIHFGADWRGAFDALLRDGTCMPDPSVLVSTPTVSDPTLAPPGGHVVYALEPVPNLDGRVDWASDAARVRDELVARVRSFGYPVDEVEVEHFVDPPAWRAAGFERGTPFSLAHRFFQSGPFRPRNVDARVPGLVLVGMGTVPGVGIPMVLLSGRLAAARVEEHASA